MLKGFVHVHMCSCDQCQHACLTRHGSTCVFDGLVFMCLRHPTAARAVAVQAALAGRDGRDKDAPMASRRMVANGKEQPSPPPPSHASSSLPAPAPSSSSSSSSSLSSSQQPPPYPPPPQAQPVISPSTSNTSIDSEERGGRVLSGTPTRQPVRSIVFFFFLK